MIGKTLRVISLYLILLALAGCGGSSVIVATFPGGSVSQRELRVAWKRTRVGLEEPKTPEARTKAMTDLARQVALMKMLEERSAAVEKNPEFQRIQKMNALIAAGEAWETQLRQRAKQQVAPQQIEQYRAAHRRALEAPGSVSWYFLFLKTRGLDAKALEAKRARARELVVQGKKAPTEFPKLVMRYSEVENPASAELLGPTVRENVPASLDALLFERLKEKEISDPVETAEGIAIFQLVKRVMKPAPSPRQVEQDVRDLLTQQQFDRMQRKEMEKLRARYPVKNHWLEKPYAQWKDDEVVYRVGPVARTFADMKAAAMAMTTLMAMGRSSAKVVEACIDNDLKAFDLTKGSGKIEQYLAEKDREKLLQQAAFASLLQDSEDFLRASLLDVAKNKYGMDTLAVPKTSLEGCRMVSDRFGRILGIASAGWYQFEEITVRPRPEKTGQTGRVSMLLGVEAAKQVRESLLKGADPKKAATFLPSDALFAAQHAPAQRHAESLLNGAQLEIFKDCKPGDWTQPLPMADGVTFYRLIASEPERPLSFAAVQNEFVPAYKRYLVIEAIKKAKEHLMGRVKVYPEKF